MADLLRETTLSMLGYQYWLIRGAVCGGIKYIGADAGDVSSALVITQKALKEDAKNIPYQLAETRDDLLDADAAMLPSSIVSYHTPVATCLVCRDAVVVIPPQTSFAWVLPPLMLDESGWRYWRSDDEGVLLCTALKACQLHQHARLLSTVFDTPIDIEGVSDQTIACQFLFSHHRLLAEHSIEMLYVVDGVAHDWVFASTEDNAELIPSVDQNDRAKSRQRYASLDWQERQVGVICITHPYSCLRDCRNKAMLWQDLMD